MRAAWKRAVSGLRYVHQLAWHAHGTADEVLGAQALSLAPAPSKAAAAAMSCEALQDAAGLKKYRLVSSSGYSAEVYEHGAHVTSWRSPAGNELLFVSKEVNCGAWARA
jgi:hypothetical protein